MSAVEDVMAKLAEEAAREVNARANKEDLIVKAYEQNQESLRDIAHITKLSHEQVRRILLKRGVQIRGRGRAKNVPPADNEP